VAPLVEQARSECAYICTEISRRIAEFKIDKYRLPLEGKNSRMGHLEQISNQVNHYCNTLRNYQHKGVRISEDPVISNATQHMQKMNKKTYHLCKTLSPKGSF
jgi:predicted DNA-binding protein (UPF0278 family)